MKNALVFPILILLLLLPLKTLIAQNQFWELYSLPGIGVHQLEIDRQNHFYAISDSGGIEKLLKSNDGISWELIFPQNADLQILLDTTNSLFDKLYVLKQVSQYPNYIDSLFYSTNSGKSWETHSLPSNLGAFYRIPEFAYNSYGVLYIPTHSNIQYSTDNGNTWEQINTPNLGFDFNTRLQIDILGNIYTNTMESEPNHGDWETIWKSEDNGLSWQSDISSWAIGYNLSAFKTLSTGEMFTGIFGDPESNLYFKKYPDQNWYIITNYKCPGNMVINKFKYIYVTKWIGLDNIVPSKFSYNYGTNWLTFDNGSLSIVDLTIDKMGYLYAATSTGIYRSVETTFPIINRKLIHFSDTAILDTALQEFKIFNPFDSQLIVDSASVSSENFYLELNGPIILEPGDSETVKIHFTPHTLGMYSDTALIYSNLKIENIFLTGNSPAPELLTDLPGNQWHFGFIYIDSTKIKTIKIINHSVNFLEIDSIYTQLPQFNVTLFNYPIYIASDSISLDISFTPDSNIYYRDTLRIVNNLMTSPYLIRLIGRGLQPTGINAEYNESYKFELYANYPNPFNPTTKIKYQLPELSNVKLTVYDVLGREIKTLVNAEKPAGSYEVEFDGNGLPSGVYFYRIESTKFSDTKKFVLLK